MFGKFDDEDINLNELTTKISVIPLKLSFSDCKEDTTKNKRNIGDIVNSVQSNSKYIIPKGSSTTNKVDNKKNSMENTTIKISNLIFDYDESSMRDLFEPFGTIRRIVQPRSKKGNQPLGYIFITYEDRISANKAIAKMDRYPYNNCILDVCFSK